MSCGAHPDYDHVGSLLKNLKSGTPDNGGCVVMSSGADPSLAQQTGGRVPVAPSFEAIGFEAAVAAERVVDSEEAARFLNINPKTLQKMAGNGNLPAYRIGKLWKFRISDPDGWLRS
jgi:excisionase family DNA binding protein